MRDDRTPAQIEADNFLSTLPTFTERATLGIVGGRILGMSERAPSLVALALIQSMDKTAAPAKQAEDLADAITNTYGAAHLPLEFEGYLIGSLVQKIVATSPDLLPAIHNLVDGAANHD